MPLKLVLTTSTMGLFVRSASKKPMPPNTPNQNIENTVGTRTTPSTNWRIVRPFEMRAMNTPTNGAQASHHTI